jgi:hypothetical protein
MADPKVTELNLTINGFELNIPDNIDKCKFLIKPDSMLPDKADTPLPENLNEADNRFHLNFLKHIAGLHTSATTDAPVPSTGTASGTTSWITANNNEMTTFLKDTTDNKIRNLVVSIQVVLIDAVKASAVPSENYAANDVAIIQFPLYRSKPTGSLIGGRRRTKAIKDKSAYRTRKHKK